MPGFGRNVSWVLRGVPAAFCGFSQALGWQVQSCLLLLKNWRANKANRSLKIAQCISLGPRAYFTGPRIPGGPLPPLFPSRSAEVPPRQARPASALDPPCLAAQQFPVSRTFLPTHISPSIGALSAPSTWLCLLICHTSTWEMLHPALPKLMSRPCSTSVICSQPDCVLLVPSDGPGTQVSLIQCATLWAAAASRKCCV